MNAIYITSAPTAQLLPRLNGPEVAVVGRSNCGKSSLINALLAHGGLARVSSTPGRTQMVNFFKVTTGEGALIVADLPGYGFSAIGREVRKHWQTLMEGYLLRREIRELLFLTDVRRALELDEDDLLLASHLDRVAPVTVVLTKSDKVNQSEAAKAQAAVRAQLKAVNIYPKQVIAVSTLKKKGIDKLREQILQHAAAMPGD
jgi:GTP-binding protein